MTYSKKLIILVTVGIGSTTLTAALVNSSWSISSGANASLSGASPGSVTMTATTTNIDAAVFTGFDEIGTSITLGNIGETLTLSGSIFINGTLAGVNSHPGSIRFGLYDTNGSSDTTAWLGYSALLDTAGTAGTSGGIFRRNTSNTTNFYSGTGATRLANYDSIEPALIAATTYIFNIKLTRAPTGIQIDSSAVNSTNSSQFFLNSSVIDTATNTSSFNRFGLYASSSGGGLGAESIVLSNIDVTKTAVPECETWLFGGGALIITTFVARRKKMKNQNH